MQRVQGVSGGQAVQGVHGMHGVREVPVMWQEQDDSLDHPMIHVPWQL